MDSLSVKRLAELVEEAEALIERVNSLDNGGGTVQIPAAPSPLTLEGTREWIKSAEEYCRKPRIAESKRLLKEKDIEAASFPADVLDSPDAIKRLITSVEAMPVEFRSPALQALAAALTKGLEDADAALDPFSTAAELVGKWNVSGVEKQRVRAVALTEIAASPQTAAQLIAIAKDTCELLGVVTAMEIVVSNFSDVQAAHDSLALFNKAFCAYSNACAAEGLACDSALPSRIMLDAATQHFDGRRRELENEKKRLQSEAASLETQLASIGVQAEESADTLSELRCAVESLKEKLAGRRAELQQALGREIFGVVDLVTRGEMPDRESLGDQEFGAALRQAVECGYRLTLEAPREN